jgi:hypothetical protein
MLGATLAHLSWPNRALKLSSASRRDRGVAAKLTAAAVYARYLCCVPRDLLRGVPRDLLRGVCFRNYA